MTIRDVAKSCECECTEAVQDKEKALGMMTVRCAMKQQDTGPETCIACKLKDRRAAGERCGNCRNAIIAQQFGTNVKCKLTGSIMYGVCSKACDKFERRQDKK